MIYARNLAAGTNNTYNRYQEMKVVSRYFGCIGESK